jgi:NADPH:quinone reductase-like Zn-dependent oxidoreductase
MTAAAIRRDASPAVEVTAVRLNAKAADLQGMVPSVERLPLGPRRPDQVLVEVKAAGVNPSDVKAATGLMPYAVFPRTPGRDFAGVVIEGPQHLVGKEVFGSSGDLGIRQDGSHATHLLVEAEAVVEKPDGITLDEGAGIGVPFVTAWEGFSRAGLPRPDDTVLVLGLNGKVGQAAAQIATWRGARVIGVVRKDEPYEGHASGPVEVIDSSRTDVPARVRELTHGEGAAIVFNTVGDPYYEAGAKSLAVLGRQILIAAIDRIVPFDILAFYKGRHTYVGVDTIALGSIESGAHLRALAPGFASGHLKPFPIRESAIHGLSDAAAAYAKVIGSSRDRLLLRPGA